MAVLATNCLYCKKVFSTTEYLKSIQKGKYCSRVCCDKSKKDRKLTQSTKDKIGLSNIGKHFVSESHRIKLSIANKGKKLSEETKNKIREKRKFQKNTVKGKHWKIKDTSKMFGHNVGEKNNQWKGGVSKDKHRRSWIKNKRNRVIKRLRIESLSHTFGEWELLKKQYGFACPSCKMSEPNIKLTVDHIIPLSKGGTDLIENIQPLCLKCNVKKHTKIIKF